MRHLVAECDADREAEVTRRQQTDERLRQVLGANRTLSAQLQQGCGSPAAQQQVAFLSDIAVKLTRNIHLYLSDFDQL